MELRHLRDFVAVAEHRSFTRAAARIRVAQPSLTRQIKNLEEELGVRLLNRSNAGISLTQEGQTFLLSAKRVLAMSAESVDTMRRMKQRDQVQLNIGYVASFHGGLLARTLARFRQELPKVALNLFDMTSAEQLTALEEGKLDLGFIAPEGNPSWPTLQRERVADHDIIVALPRQHALFKKPALAPIDLAECFMIGFSEAFWRGWRDWINQVFSDSNINIQILQEAENETVALKLVALGLGIAFLPEQLRPMPHPGLGFRPLKPILKISSSIAWNSKNDSKYLDQYIRIIKRTASLSS